MHMKKIINKKSFALINDAGIKRGSNHRPHFFSQTSLLSKILFFDSDKKCSEISDLKNEI